MDVLLCLVSAALLFSQVQCDEEEHVPDAKEYERLLDDLWVQSSVARRHTPPFNSEGIVDVKFGMSLLFVKSLDKNTGVAELLMWDRYEWKDERLSWDADDYGGATALRVPSTMFWMPDIITYNSMSRREEATKSVHSVVSHDGTITYVPPSSRKILCSVSEDSDKASCSIKVGSWTYNGLMLDLNLYGNEASIDASNFKPSGGVSAVSNNSAEKHTTTYDCCPEPYIDLTFSFDLELSEEGSAAAEENADGDDGGNGQ